MQANIRFIEHPRLKQQLRPLTDHRSIADLLLGTSTIREKWDKATKILNVKDPSPIEVNISALPSEPLLNALNQFNSEEAIFAGDLLIAKYENCNNPVPIYLETLDLLLFPEDLLGYQQKYLRQEIIPESFNPTDYQSSGTIIISPENCYIHPTANLKGCILDASNGPIFIGAHANLQIGTLIQGPAAILDHATTNLGAKIRPFTTIGKHCKVGGEISFSILHAYTNKSHEGYLGNSIIGSFCNFGALSNSSNVKNDLKPVQLYDYTSNSFRQTNQQSIGLITGDFITTGIGSQFNTATTIGSHCNITCHQFPPRYIPSFSWGQFPNFEKFNLHKAISNAKIWAESKKQELSIETINRIHEIWKEL